MNNDGGIPGTLTEPKAHTCINTVNVMAPQMGCEACYEAPRCPHGWRLMLDKCAHCEVEALRERVKELEDTILLRAADEAIHRSYGRNAHAIHVSDEIGSRRGKEWNGAVVEGLDRL